MKTLAFCRNEASVCNLVVMVSALCLCLDRSAAFVIAPVHHVGANVNVGINRKNLPKLGYCMSDRVETIVTTSPEAAKAKLDQLEADLSQHAAEGWTKLDATKNEIFASAGILDANVLVEGTHTLVEYTSEFTLDKIETAVRAALHDIEVRTDDTAIACYTDAINARIEVSRGAYEHELKFAIFRIAPGLFVSIYTISERSQGDDDIFGEEPVTATSILYRFADSAVDAENGVSFDAKAIDSKTVVVLKYLRADLANQLADGKMDVATWTQKEDRFQERIDAIEARLKGGAWDR